MKGEKKKKPEELRMPFDEFDEMMRCALGAPPEHCRSRENGKSPCKSAKQKKKPTK